MKHIYQKIILSIIVAIFIAACNGSGSSNPGVEDNKTLSATQDIMSTGLTQEQILERLVTIEPIEPIYSSYEQRSSVDLC